MGAELVAVAPRRAVRRTVEQLHSDGVRVFGALGHAECDAYAAAVTDRERAQYAFHA
jgi:hypothetical protein